ncbi:SDR family NAD(P)-dependent oxidoreductase [Aeoliella mucimassa]|uniref:Putative oxidoreductase n=1 Tax=Aeoliella mucimassa TaxID=2527972 RepID=A0A518AKF2_9BACT|nr:SDR family NAD(P)-dependent oxidoreductase [Aeoliella mucimassa]QDU55209.1 putative oxidoreductase [Aeoliella mucimassa]
MNYWQNKACLITGGSAGLGRILAETLIAAGARVVINGRDEQRLAETTSLLRVDGSDVLGAPGDITERGFAHELVASVVETLGGLDFVCHAAGRSMRGELTSTSREEFDALWKINTRAAFDLAKAAVDPLTTSHGHYVMIGSLASRLAPRFLGAYSESKFPLAAMAQQLRLERGPAGLHTLLVCPGPIKRIEPTAGDRYGAAVQGLPDSATKPGGGAKVGSIDPHKLCEKILRSCEKRKAELIMPRRARLLFVLNQLSPNLGDWLLRKMSG